MSLLCDPPRTVRNRPASANVLSREVIDALRRDLEKGIFTVPTGRPQTGRQHKASVPVVRSSEAEISARIEAAYGIDEELKRTAVERAKRLGFECEDTLGMYLDEVFARDVVAGKARLVPSDDNRNIRMIVRDIRHEHKTGQPGVKVSGNFLRSPEGKSLLIALYVDDLRPVCSIATELGVSTALVKGILVYHGIGIRSKGESQRIRWGNHHRVRKPVRAMAVA